MSDRLLPYDTIIKAHEGDPIAIQAVLDRYAGYIRLSDIRPPEIEIELEKEIEKEREGETGHPAPAAYGRYNNVILTDGKHLWYSD